MNWIDKCYYDILLLLFTSLSIDASYLKTQILFLFILLLLLVL